MLKLQIPKNRINDLTRHIREHFDIERLERGWAYFHQSRVSSLELKHGLEVHALVRGTTTYKVTLDLESFGKSGCSCPDGPHCKHIAAVAFALYAPYFRPELVLAELLRAVRVRQKQQQARQQSAGKAAPAKAERLEPPTPDQTPGQWQKFFDQQFHGFSLTQQHSIELFQTAVKETLVPHGKAWEEPLRSLYALHLLLFVMRKIEQFYLDTKSSYLSYYIETGCRAVARQSQEELLQLMPELDVDALIGGYAEYWKQTLAYISEAALTGKESPLSWATVYRSVWWRMERREDWIAAERKRLRQLAAQEGTPRRRDALLLAEAHFDVVEGRDEAARQRMGALSRREPKDFYLYLHRCYEQENWERMLAWLRWLLPAMQRAQQEDMRQFCQYWAEAVQRQDNDEEWAEVMVALLPRTYQFYTAYLMRAGRYKAWIDLQLANRVAPQELYAPDLQTVEKTDPSLILPLFHQSVERAISEKNRTAYKTAVKLLKKLHAVYKKMDRLPIWEEYIFRLASKHSRLRALQEELRKGKWIP